MDAESVRALRTSIGELVAQLGNYSASEVGGNPEAVENLRIAHLRLSEAVDAQRIYHLRDLTDAIQRARTSADCPVGDPRTTALAHAVSACADPSDYDIEEITNDLQDRLGYVL